MYYQDNSVYKVLEKLIMAAGVDVIYQQVPDDSIDGATWARSDYNMPAIMMPDSDKVFPDCETACLILGHEMGHILTRLDSTDDASERRMNEAICDQVGVYLFRLACMIDDYNMESSWSTD